MKAVVTVIGKDTVGILASTAQTCAQKNGKGNLADTAVSLFSR